MKQRDRKIILGTTPIERDVMIQSFPSWMLVRPGDQCIIRSVGVKQVGFCQRIINLSCGKRLLVMRGSDGDMLGLYNAEEVELVDNVARTEHITTYEALLRYYAPKGMTTANS